MIPSGIMQLEKIPVNRSGKLDKNALPEIVLERTEECVLPETEKESLLVKVLENVLGMECISMKDNFFEAGGDSIKAIRVSSKIREMGKELKVKDIMRAQDIRCMAEFMEDMAVRINQNEVTGEYRLSPIQSLFFKESYEEQNHYNQSLMVMTKEYIEMEYLKQALHAIVFHHDILRTKFTDKQAVIQPMEEYCGYKISEFDFSAIKDEEIRKEKIAESNSRIQKEINIYDGPLLYAALYHTEHSSHIFFCVHHLVIDSISWGIFREDMEHAYLQLKNGKDLMLPQKTVSYADWTSFLYEYGKRDEVKDRVRYWEKIVCRISESNLPEENTRLPYKVLVTEYSLQKEETYHLLYDVNHIYNTGINALLLCALGMAVWKCKGIKSAAVELEGHGREELDKDIPIGRTMGWFTNLYPVILNNLGTDIEDMLIRVKEDLRMNEKNGISYGILAEQEEYNLRRHRAAICFNYLGDMDNMLANGSLFRSSPYENGANISEKNKKSAIIAMDCYVADGRFWLRAAFDQSRIHADHAKELFLKFMDALSEVIAFCLSKTETVDTASDFGAVGMDRAEFDELFDAFLE